MIVRGIITLQTTVKIMISTFTNILAAGKNSSQKTFADVVKFGKPKQRPVKLASMLRNEAAKVETEREKKKKKESRPP